MTPIFLGYLEESLYTSGHFQAIQPVGGNIPIRDFLQINEDKVKGNLAGTYEKDKKMTWVEILFPEAYDCKVKVGPKRTNLVQEKAQGREDNICEIGYKKKWTDIKSRTRVKYQGKNKEVSCKKVEKSHDNKVDSNKTPMNIKDIRTERTVLKKIHFVTQVKL